MQPAVLPSRFPNLLVNGSSGIAVGMATNIPPHNLGEVIDGVICMIDNPDCTIDDLMQHIKGPDFPTGGIILGRRGIREAYYTGHGRIEVRAKTNIEEMPNGRSRIVVTEIPYQVNKAKLVEKIAELVHDKRIEGISDIRDESDRQGMRIVIELKKDVYPQVILNTLYKHTSMQETFGANMLALVNGQPKILSLRDMVYYYLEHQKDVVTRRTRFDLNKALARAHILEGLLKALDHIDEIVSIIRASKDPNTAKTTLMERFDFSDKQAQAILDMRLARLTGLERDRLQQEYDDLVSACNVGLIFLDNRFTIPNYPSRLLSYLENRMPVLMATDMNTDIGPIAEKNGYGLWTESGNLETFMEMVEFVTEDREKLKLMGEKGYDYLKEKYTIERTYRIIMKHFQ